MNTEPERNHLARSVPLQGLDKVIHDMRIQTILFEGADKTKGENKLRHLTRDGIGYDNGIFARPVTAHTVGEGKLAKPIMKYEVQAEDLRFQGSEVFLGVRPQQGIHLAVVGSLVLALPFTGVFSTAHHIDQHAILVTAMEIIKGDQVGGAILHTTGFGEFPIAGIEGGRTPQHHKFMEPRLRGDHFREKRLNLPAGLLSDKCQHARQIGADVGGAVCQCLKFLVGELLLRGDHDLKDMLWGEVLQEVGDLGAAVGGAGIAIVGEGDAPIAIVDAKIDGLLELVIVLEQDLVFAKPHLEPGGEQLIGDLTGDPDIFAFITDEDIPMSPASGDIRTNRGDQAAQDIDDGKESEDCASHIPEVFQLNNGGPFEGSQFQRLKGCPAGGFGKMIPGIYRQEGKDEGQDKIPHELFNGGSGAVDARKLSVVFGVDGAVKTQVVFEQSHGDDGAKQGSQQEDHKR